MARTKREQSPIGVYHAVLRSTENLFPSDNDKTVFEDLCRRYFSGKSLYSLALTSDRIHMVFTDGGEGAASAIKPLTTSYARYYNRTYKREGKLFSDRFKSTAVKDTAQLCDCVVYVDSTYGASELCDKDSFFKDVCSEAQYERRMTGKLEVVCLDAFDMFTKSDVLTMMCRIADVELRDVLDMTDRQKRALVRTAAEQKWVSVRRMSEALGLEKPASVARTAAEPKKRTAPKASKPKTAAKPAASAAEEKPVVEEKKQNNRDLSVWLL